MVNQYVWRTVIDLQTRWNSVIWDKKILGVSCFNLTICPFLPLPYLFLGRGETHVHAKLYLGSGLTQILKIRGAVKARAILFKKKNSLRTGSYLGKLAIYVHLATH